MMFQEGVLLNSVLLALIIVFEFLNLAAVVWFIWRYDRLAQIAERYEATARRSFEVTDLVTASLSVLNVTIRESSNLNDVRSQIASMLKSAGVSIEGATVNINRDLIGGDKSTGRDEVGHDVNTTRNANG